MDETYFHDTIRNIYLASSDDIQREKNWFVPSREIDIPQRAYISSAIASHTRRKLDEQIRLGDLLTDLERSFNHLHRGVNHSRWLIRFLARCRSRVSDELPKLKSPRYETHGGEQSYENVELSISRRIESGIF